MKIEVGKKVKIVGGYRGKYNGRIATVTAVMGGRIMAATKEGLSEHSGDEGDFHYCFTDREYEPIAEWAEDDDLNAICDERQDGPFIKFYGTLKTPDKSWPHNGEWSNWFMSGVDGTIKNSLMRGKECEVETQKLAGCKQVAYRFRIKPKPVRETVTLYGGAGYGLGYEFDRNLTEHCSHRLTFTTTDGKPATGTFTNENGDVIIMEEV